ncbi:carboxypeptidase-like regulatory domain-containing protein [Winogradskyella aurantia]|uniref:Carboxypeptidase-like regulatory domain-containing protein n=1 Tax=Winogradskyella aurantia TaxID=1915063 RepID=A0A265UNC5_9FLAO|nr:carboxypeptidase-like regulatory domain-containing protein [Winogradskyella aurantia]OZV66810.1 hypothetical protein CA834_13290 [Winogradskyella aurantia]
MKNTHYQKYGLKLNLLILSLVFSSILAAQTVFSEYSGIVIDGNTKKPLEAVSLIILNENLSTVTNSEGEFVLKIPNQILNPRLVASYLGYKNFMISLSELQDNKIKIELYKAVTELSEVNISAFKNAKALVERVFENKAERLQNESVIMTAFYRETIKRRKRNVSLTEAVVDIYKEPYTSRDEDIIALSKARKSTDYKRLDTVSVKLQGGPYSTIYLDLMKYPEYIFTEETIPFYDFEFKDPTNIDNRNVYVVYFKTKDSGLNINYNGNLYIDSKTLALVSADYYLDLSNRARTKNLLVKRKPRDVVVYPLEANYKVDYKISGNKWHFNYANLNLTFKINKKRQLFNKVYTLSSEMAITDWEINTTDKKVKAKDRLKPSVIIADAISGFSDPDFWGAYNLIEPDKSIETAIEKIQKSIEREKARAEN